MRAGWGTGFLALSERAIDHLTPVFAGLDRLRAAAAVGRGARAGARRGAFSTHDEAGVPHRLRPCQRHGHRRCRAGGHRGPPTPPSATIPAIRWPTRTATSGSAVDETRELVDMMETARNYQNNVEVMQTAKKLIADTLKWAAAHG